MKTILAAVLFGLGAAAQAADVGVSIAISQPGIYGRIDLGRFPQPVVVVNQPVVIRQAAVATPMQPVYLWVPPGHQKHWAKHCGKYNACGHPVYFVRDDWYNQNVNPGGHGHGHDHGHGQGKGKGKGHDKD